jgi:hypothetical protein
MSERVAWIEGVSDSWSVEMFRVWVLVGDFRGWGWGDRDGIWRSVGGFGEEVTLFTRQ